MSTWWDDDEPVGLGIVVTDERGSLPFHLVHGEALAAAAAWALGEAEVSLLDLSVPWSSIREADEPLVLHDSLCPLTPPDFIAACLAEAIRLDQVVVGVRPVTDTVKQVEAGLIGATVDRESLTLVCSPVVLPSRVVAAMPDPPASDFTDLVVALRALGEDVVLQEAPSTARRVGGADDIAVLEALTGADREQVLG
ncbi:MAG: 2-C-methyl-D-erythritol 4-phosphate cytidylyltransferase [Nocardioides sp.]